MARFSSNKFRSMQGEAQVKPSMLARTFSINLKQLVGFLLMVIVVLAVGYWTVQRVDMYKRWASQIEKAQSLRTHLDQAYIQLSSNSFETDNTTQDWFTSELKYAIYSLLHLIRLDERYELQLRRIEAMLVNLLDPTMRSYLVGLDSTDRNVIARALHDIGWKVVSAYGNYINYTSSNPPLWYSGPSPPDEAILEEAVELAINLKKNLLP